MQAGKRRFLQLGTHVSVAIHSPHDDHRGDFNCVLSQTDCTGNINYSKALERVVRDFDLTDVWETTPQIYIYALYPTWRGTFGPRVSLT
jgi:hypothetical protein